MAISPQIGMVALAVLVAWCLRSATNRSSPGSLGAWWWALVGLTLVCFRAPLWWVPHEFNPDEGQLIATAMSLRHDPVYWRSADSYTAGPLVFYPLLPTAWTSGLHAFAIARAIALAAEFGVLLLLGELLGLIASPLAARAAVLPALAFLAFTSQPDFLFYSTEIAPLLLLAAAVHLLGRQSLSASREKMFALAVLVGAVPWAKMQAAPIAAVVGCLALLQEVVARRHRSLAPLMVGGLLPTLAVLTMVTFTDQTDHFAASFGFNTLNYIGASQSTFSEVCVAHWDNAVKDGYLALWIAGSLLFGLATLTLTRGGTAETRRLLAVAVVLLTVCTACVLAPLRPYAHYLHFLTLPLLLETGAVVALALAVASDAPARPVRSVAIAAVFLSLCLAPQIARRASGANYFRNFVGPWKNLDQQDLLRVLAGYTRPGDSMAVWGWRSSLYVDTGMRPATRNAQSEATIHHSPWQRYFLRRYFDDFVAANPSAFVDAVGRGNFMFMDRRDAHECFLRLNQRINSLYTLVAEVSGTRVYIRNDRVAESRIGAMALDANSSP